MLARLIYNPIVHKPPETLMSDKFHRDTNASHDPYLLTPGPLTTSLTVKQAMLHDYGSRDSGFIALNREILDTLNRLVDGHSHHDHADNNADGNTDGDDDCITVPLQGSGTYLVEAMIGNFVPACGELLICINGAYGHRIAKICDYYQRKYQVLEWAENEAVDAEKVDAVLANDANLSHVVAVYCETTSGILNPLEAISAVVAAHGRSFLIDAMSAFGALPLSREKVVFDALVASSNKCLEGVPGMGFCITHRAALEKTKGNSPSLSLDLYDQWQGFANNGQWRFTPPTHVLLALAQALQEHQQEGGVDGRGRRYRRNAQVLIEGMRRLGFKTLLDDNLQAPIIITFLMPTNPQFNFAQFYERLREQGYVIYPGKLTVADSFRIGCIGRLEARHMLGVIAAIEIVLGEFGLLGKLHA